MEDVKKEVLKFLAEYGLRIIGALIIMAVGAFIARWVGGAADRWFTKKQVEPPLKMLAVRVVRLLVFALAVVLALDKCGVPIAPMVAGIGVAGVGIGLALQGVLSNLVAGLLIIFTKPFRVGEYIELIGVSGQVTTVELFSTTLLHPDRSRVVIPNRKIVGEVLHNYGTIRQLDLSANVAYGTDMSQAFEIIRGILDKNTRVLKDPAAVFGITVLGDSAVRIAIKPWVSVADFVSACAEINQSIVEQFRARNFAIPYPHREIRLLNGTSANEAAPVSDARRL